MILFDTQKIEIFFKNAHNNHSISEDRKVLIIKIAEKIFAIEKGDFTNTRLNFICTHNSRRSQFAQVWAYYAAHYFNLPITALSGGTAVTAFYKNTISALQEVGFGFRVLHFDHQNPTYAINFDSTTSALLGFSKLYDNPINKDPFYAITTCGDADVNCPYIPEAKERFHLGFVDPKAFDHTEKCKEAYLNTSTIIAAELYLLFETLKNLQKKTA